MPFPALAGTMGGLQSALPGLISSGGGGNLLGMLGNIGGPLFGGFLGNRAMAEAQRGIEDRIEFNPFSGYVGGVGGFSRGGFQLDPTLNMQRGLLGIQVPDLLTGGFANDPLLGAAVRADGGLLGATENANALLGTQLNPFFDPSGFAATAGNIGALGSGLTGAVLGGPTDLSGIQSELFGGGLSAIAGAGDQSGLIQQNLDASRGLAAEGENRIINNFLNREFGATRGATSGSADRERQLIQSLQSGDNQRILNAQQLGLQAAGQQQALGQGLLGAGSNIMGQNLGAYRDLLNSAQGFNQLGLQTEAQGFGQMAQALGLNQSAGQQRLGNMLNLFNTQTGAFNDAFGLGLGGIGQMLGIGQLGLDGMLGFFNAEANRIGATGMSNQAIANLASRRGGLLGGLFG